MVESTMSVSSVDALRECFADYLSRRAKEALAKAGKLYHKDSDSYRLAAAELTDASDDWRERKIEFYNKPISETDAIGKLIMSVSSLDDLQQEIRLSSISVAVLKRH
jgi:hypothetical protein